MPDRYILRVKMRVLKVYRCVVCGAVLTRRSVTLHFRYRHPEYYRRYGGKVTTLLRHGLIEEV